MIIVAYATRKQFDESRRGPSVSDVTDARSEMRLLAAILTRAIMDVVVPPDTLRPHIRREAKQWLYYWEDTDKKQEWTFPWVCENLNLCPHTVRRTVRQTKKWKEENKLISGRLSERLETFIVSIYYDPDNTTSIYRTAKAKKAQ